MGDSTTKINNESIVFPHRVELVEGKTVAGVIYNEDPANGDEYVTITFTDGSSLVIIAGEEVGTLDIATVTDGPTRKFMS